MADKRNKTEKIKPRYLKVVYKSPKDILTEAIIELPLDDYFNKTTYKEHIDNVMTDIFDEGGVWINASTVIPFHRILALHTHQEQVVKADKTVKTEKKDKPVLPSGRRGRGRGKKSASTVSTDNKVS